MNKCVKKEMQHGALEKVLRGMMSTASVRPRSQRTSRSRVKTQCSDLEMLEESSF
jgi:hypothetical protein